MDIGPWGVSCKHCAVVRPHVIVARLIRCLRATPGPSPEGRLFPRVKGEGRAQPIRKPDQTGAEQPYHNIA